MEEGAIMKRMYHFGLYDFADGFISECLATDVEAAQNILQIGGMREVA